MYFSQTTMSMNKMLQKCDITRIHFTSSLCDPVYSLHPVFVTLTGGCCVPPDWSGRLAPCKWKEFTGWGGGQSAASVKTNRTCVLSEHNRLLLLTKHFSKLGIQVQQRETPLTEFPLHVWWRFSGRYKIIAHSFSLPSHTSWAWSQFAHNTEPHFLNHYYILIRNRHVSEWVSEWVSEFWARIQNEAAKWTHTFKKKKKKGNSKIETRAVWKVQVLHNLLRKL